MGWRNVGFIFLLIGCADATVTSRGGVTTSGALRLEVQSLAGQSADWQALVPGGALTSGSMFAVKLTVPSPLFISLWQRGGDGSTAQLYPPATAKGDVSSAAPDRPAFFPSPGKWFALDDHSGEERIFVLASAQKLEAGAARKPVDERGEPARIGSREPPPEVKERDRGEAVVGTLSSDGIAVLCFPFSHRPR